MASKTEVNQWRSLDGHTTITRDESTGRLSHRDDGELICSTACGLEDACTKVVVGDEVLIEKVAVLPTDHAIFKTLAEIQAMGEVLFEDDAEKAAEIGDSLDEICDRYAENPADAQKELDELLAELGKIQKEAAEKKAAEEKAAAEPAAVSA